MSVLSIPVTADVAHFDLQVKLEGKTYTLELRWNERANLWSLTIYDVAGEVLAAGRAMVLGAQLLGRSGDERLPPGLLYLLDTSGRGVEAGRTDLGQRVQLLYVPAGGA